ncbi:hypothetical protein PAPYR_8207 [Paratrimastix pyriformis]|uniref:N-alpha-acetyltransferase 60 n=1 Tax=Paratrimastix pyriformis TaxID=342808 RepID=A0ABQ8UGM2_9EUKA|nr:hypothetical protein PAPYR_8207 [Paratrimastix pyriformis]
MYRTVCCVALDDPATILGAVVCRVTPVQEAEDIEGAFPEVPAGQCLAHILTLGIRKTVRQQGLGAILLRHFLEDAWRNGRCWGVFLHVLTTNTAAIRLYEKCGFVRAAHLRSVVPRIRLAPPAHGPLSCCPARHTALHSARNYYLIGEHQLDAYLMVHRFPGPPPAPLAGADGDAPPALAAPPAPRPAPAPASAESWCVIL